MHQKMHHTIPALSWNQSLDSGEHMRKTGQRSVCAVASCKRDVMAHLGDIFHPFPKEC